MFWIQISRISQVLKVEREELIKVKMRLNQASEIIVFDFCVLVFIEDEFEVERIMKSKKDKNGNWMLFIRWANHAPSEDSWIPASNLLDPIYTYDFDESIFHKNN